MRQLRVFAFLFSVLITSYAHAIPLHFDVKGIIDARLNHGASPIAHGTNVTGWYELDWDKSKLEIDYGNSAIYSGILTYKFLIGGLTLTGSNPNIHYYSPTSGISQNNENMMFQDTSPNLANIGNFKPIEDLFFYVSNKNGVRKARFDYDSVPDNENADNHYSGWCELTVQERQVLEPSSLFIFIFGLTSIFLMRMKRKN